MPKPPSDQSESLRYRGRCIADLLGAERDHLRAAGDELARAVLMGSDTLPRWCPLCATNGYHKPENCPERKPDQSKSVVERVTNVLRDELSPWIATHPNAGLFDWRVLAETVLRVASDEEGR